MIITSYPTFYPSRTWFFLSEDEGVEMREEKPIHVWVVLGMDERTELPATIRVAASGAEEALERAGLWHEEGDWSMAVRLGRESPYEERSLYVEGARDLTPWNSLSFYEWLLLQQLRDDPVGDLGELVASVDWPQGEGLASLRWTLRERWPEYEEALERAWGEYRKVLHVDPASS